MIIRTLCFFVLASGDFAISDFYRDSAPRHHWGLLPLYGIAVPHTAVLSPSLLNFWSSHWARAWNMQDINNKHTYCLVMSLIEYRSSLTFELRGLGLGLGWMTLHHIFSVRIWHFLVPCHRFFNIRNRSLMATNRRRWKPWCSRT